MYKLNNTTDELCLLLLLFYCASCLFANSSTQRINTHKMCRTQNPNCSRKPFRTRTELLETKYEAGRGTELLRYIHYSTQSITVTPLMMRKGQCSPAHNSTQQMDQIMATDILVGHALRKSSHKEWDRQKSILYTDLWTRDIHLLQIEPSRSAETPNSLRDLNDMLTNNDAALVLPKSNSTPAFFSWSLSIHSIDGPWTEKYLTETKAFLLPPAATVRPESTTPALETSKTLLVNRQILSYKSSSGALAMVQRVTFSLFATAGEQSHIVLSCWQTLFTVPLQHNGPSQRDAIGHRDGYVQHHGTGLWQLCNFKIKKAIVELIGRFEQYQLFQRHIHDAKNVNLLRHWPPPLQPSTWHSLTQNQSLLAYFKAFCHCVHQQRQCLGEMHHPSTLHWSGSVTTSVGSSASENFVKQWIIFKYRCLINPQEEGGKKKKSHFLHQGRQNDENATLVPLTGCR